MIIYFRDFEMQTEKDCRIIFCEGFSQMLLYDMYAQDVAIEEEKKKLIERERQKYLHGKGGAFNFLIFSILSVNF